MGVQDQNLQVIITRGLPASGKTTWVKEFMKTSEMKWKRYNRDEMRQMTDLGEYSSENETLLRDFEIGFTIRALIHGFNVIIDGTNLNMEHTAFFLESIETSHAGGIIPNVAVLFKDFFSVPVSECLKRDKAREKSVGHDVIMKFAHILAGLQKGFDEYEQKQ